MSLSSMTGFGRGAAEDAAGSVQVEVKSVNHRFLEVRTRCVPPCPEVEQRVEERVRAALSRGKVDVQVRLRPAPGVAGAPRLDVDALRGLAQELEPLRRDLGAAPLALEMLLQAPGVLSDGNGTGALAALEGTAAAAAIQAVDGLNRVRNEEGRALAAELDRLLGALAALHGEAEVFAPEARQRIFPRLKERMRELMEGVAADETRLIQEAALLADRADVTEELTRLGAHLSAFRVLLGGADPSPGRRMDFLCQEFLREVNTFASKVRDAGGAALAVSMKTVIEQIKEQVQNVT